MWQCDGFSCFIDLLRRGLIIAKPDFECTTILASFQILVLHCLYSTEVIECRNRVLEHCKDMHKSCLKPTSTALPWKLYSIFNETKQTQCHPIDYFESVQ